MTFTCIVSHQVNQKHIWVFIDIAEMLKVLQINVYVLLEWLWVATQNTKLLYSTCVWSWTTENMIILEASIMSPVFYNSKGMVWFSGICSLAIC